MFGHTSTGVSFGKQMGLPFSSSAACIPSGTLSCTPSILVHTSVGGGVQSSSQPCPSGQDGSSCPVSNAITKLRPCASAKKPPIPGNPLMLLIETLIGFCPVCSLSSTPGVPTYLHTNTLSCSAPAIAFALKATNATTASVAAI